MPSIESSFHWNFRRRDLFDIKDGLYSWIWIILVFAGAFLSLSLSHPLEIPSSLLPFKTIAILNNTRAAISSIELIEEDRRGKVRETLQNVWTSSLKLQNDYT